MSVMREIWVSGRREFGLNGFSPLGSTTAKIKEI